MEKTPRTELKRALGPWAAASIVVGTVIGSGIFLVPKTMIQKVGTVEAVFAVWVVGGLLSLAGALSYAELASALPEAGGEYAFLREAYGPLWGFLYSWTQLWVAKSGSIATLATGFFLYLTNFFEPLKGVIYTVPLNIGPNGKPLEIQYGQLFAIALILSLGWLNYYGVKVGGNVQVAVTFLKVALIAAIILAGLALGHAHAPEAGAVAPLTFSGFIAALVAALWAYDGWNNVSMVSSEIKDPQRNLPRALIGGPCA
jgi:APA family basic amino acid/polyamine antiporter